jgi:hypothetical protein
MILKPEYKIRGYKFMAFDQNNYDFRIAYSLVGIVFRACTHVLHYNDVKTRSMLNTESRNTCLKEIFENEHT